MKYEDAKEGIDVRVTNVNHCSCCHPDNLKRHLNIGDVIRIGPHYRRDRFYDRFYVYSAMTGKEHGLRHIYYYSHVEPVSAQVSVPAVKGKVCTCSYEQVIGRNGIGIGCTCGAMAAEERIL
jgi:hypothetical protein